MTSGAADITSLEAPGAGGDDPLLGQTLDGRYTLEAVVARGTMGVVYRARQTRVDRPVAVKVLRRSLCGDPQLAGRFLREARVLSLLHHPNLLTIYDFGRTESGQLYLITEFLAGRTLREHLEEREALDEATVLDVVRQVADGLEAMHARGVVHRDLKPDNLFLVPLGRGRHLVKILDFGLAALDDGGGERLTRLGATVGTPAYMSPEQLGGRDLDGRSDLYSLGCLAYEILTGAVPFTARSLPDLARAHCRERPAPPRGASPAATLLLLRLLEKDAEDRPQSAAALLDQLEASGPGGLPAASPAPGGGSRSSLWRRMAAMALPVMLAALGVTLAELL